MSNEKQQHDLKCWPEFFQAVKRGDKGFEVRVNDRDYQVGHILNLQEFNPNDLHGIGDYTGDSCKCLVTYILSGNTFGSEYFGVKRDTVIMSIKKLEE